MRINKQFIKITGLVIFLIISMTCFIPANTVLADSPGLHITGTSIVLDMQPGQSQISTITVSNDSTMDVSITTGGLGQTADGSTVVLTEQEDTGTFSARSFITVDKTSVHLAPGVAQDINVTLNVPAGTTPGERYAAIHILQVADTSASFVIGSIIPVIINTPGYTPDQAGNITGIEVPTAYSGNPLEIKTTFLSTSNCRITNGTYKITITNMTSGQTVWQKDATGIPGNSILPGFPRTIDVTYRAGLSMGNYNVKTDIMLPGWHHTGFKNCKSTGGRTSTAARSTFSGITSSSDSPGPIIDTLTPILQWNTISGADYYDVVVNNYSNNSYNILFSLNEIDTTSLTLPDYLLGSNEKYSWQVKSHNVSGWGDMSAPFYFQTKGNAPSVYSFQPGDITANSATLNGNLTGRGSTSSVTVSFEFGMSTNYGNTTTDQTMTAAGAFHANITGLTPGTTYHFRAKAVGSSTVYGSDLTFTTLSVTTTTTTPQSTNTSETTSTGNTTTTNSRNRPTASKITRSSSDYLLPGMGPTAWSCSQLIRRLYSLRLRMKPVWKHCCPE